MKKIFILILLIISAQLLKAQQTSSEIVSVDNLTQLQAYFGGAKQIYVKDTAIGGYFYLYQGGSPVDGVNIFSGANSSKWRRVKVVPQSVTNNGIKLVNGSGNLKVILNDPSGFVKLDSAATPGSIYITYDTVRQAKYNRDHPLQLGLPISGPLKSSVTLDTLFFLKDSSGLVSDARLNRTGDSIQVKINGVWVSKIPLGPGVSITNLAALKAITPTTGTTLRTLGYGTANGGGAAVYKYDATSATADNRTVITPNSGVGRYILQVFNRRISTNQLGIFGDNSTDYTTAWNAMAIFTSTNLYKLAVDVGSYIIDPSSGGVILQTNLNIEGVDSAYCNIVTKVYSGQNKSVFTFYPNASERINNVSISKLHFNSPQTYASHAFAPGNPIADTSSRYIAFQNGDNIRLSQNIYENGASTSAVFFTLSSYVYVEKSTFKGIGGMGVSTFYNQANHHIWVTDNLGWSWGNRDRYDGGAPTGLATVRFGDDFYEAGGSFNYVNHNILWNKMKTRWFWIEARVRGYNEFNDNELHGEGMNCFGTSIGNDYITNPPIPRDVRIQRNRQDSVLFDYFTSVDSIGGKQKYLASNLIELAGEGDMDFSQNYLMHPHFTLARTLRNLRIHDNIMRSPNSATDNEAGASIVFLFGPAGNSSVDGVHIYDNHIFMKDGEIFRTQNNGDTVKNSPIEHNDITWTGTLILGEIYPGMNGVQPDIKFINNTLSGNVFSAFYNDNTGTGQIVNMSGNDFSKTNIDPANGTVMTDFHVASIMNWDGCNFPTSGYYTSNKVPFRRTASNVNTTLLPTDYMIAYTVLSAGRTVTLPSASSVSGKHFIVQDETGAAGSNNITISGTISGVSNPVINTAYGSYKFYSNGSIYIKE